MSAFVNAMDAAATTKSFGWNGAPEYTAAGVGDPRVALFAALVRNLPAPRLKDLVQDILDVKDPQLTADLFVMIFQTRNPRGGKGERFQGRSLFQVVYKSFPETTIQLIPLMVEFGYYKDLLIMADETKSGQLREALIDAYASQLQKDREEMKKAGESKRSPNLSLAAKYAPRKAKSFDRKEHSLYKALKQKLFGNAPKSAELYRRLVSQMCLHLRVVEQAMNAQKFSTIELSQVPSIAMKTYAKAFLNEKSRTVPTESEEETGNRHPENEDRIACRRHMKELLASKTKTVKASVLMPHDIVRPLMGRTSQSKDHLSLMEEQWKVIRETVLKSFNNLEENALHLGNMVPLVDVSGSMAGTPMEVAIALGILVSEITAPAFRDRFLTFDTTPNWVNLSKCKSLAEKVSVTQQAPWGGSTDFEKAMNHILEVAVQAKLSPSEIPSLIVFSDMQFNSATCSPWDTLYDSLTKTFADRGRQVVNVPWPLPPIIFWNLQGQTSGFPVQSNTKGVLMLSGFSPSLLKLVLNGKDLSQMTPYLGMREALDEACYDPIRTILDASQEGILEQYKK